MNLTSAITPNEIEKNTLATGGDVLPAIGIQYLHPPGYYPNGLLIIAQPPRSQRSLDAAASACFPDQ